jgi:hypothetical protein
MQNQFADIDYWKGIVLYGLNQATYKIALGKTLIDLTNNGKSTLDWHELSKAFLDNYIARLNQSDMPQQSNPSRQTTMERIVSGIKSGQLSYQQAVSEVGVNAFNDVIPRFQTIGTDKQLAAGKFYHYDFGKQIHIHDALFNILETSKHEIIQELEARWSLLEGAFSLTHGECTLANSIREIYLEKATVRSNLTGNIPFLQGYQGNVCFYCGEGIEKASIHVDHLIPRQVIQHDEIWNLVISHDVCNLHKSDALVGKHYFEKLVARNENIMGSNHPWKQKIASALGSTSAARYNSMYRHYEHAKIILRSRYWEHAPNYNRETDPFFKKLITKLNNS